VRENPVLPDHLQNVVPVGFSDMVGGSGGSEAFRLRIRV